MRPVPAGRQRGQCCTPYSRLQEEIDNVETIAVTANNTANNAANAANTAVNTANSAASDAADALAGLTDGSVTQIGTSNVGTDTKPIKLVGGVPTIVTNDLVDTATAQTVGGAKTYTGQQIATGQRAYDPANTDDIATIGTLDAYTPMVRTSGNQTIAGDKTLTGLTTLSISRIAATGSSGYRILYKFKNDHSQTLLFTGGRSIVIAQVHRNGGYKKTLVTSGRDYDNSWMWSVKDNSGNYYLIVKGQYSATMNAHVINSFLYGSVYNYLNDIEIIDQSTTDPTSDPQWTTVNEVGNYD